MHEAARDHRALERAHLQRGLAFDVNAQPALQDEPALVPVGVAVPWKAAFHAGYPQVVAPVQPEHVEVRSRRMPGERLHHIEDLEGTEAATRDRKSTRLNSSH